MDSGVWGLQAPWQVAPRGDRQVLQQEQWGGAVQVEGLIWGGRGWSVGEMSPCLVSCAGTMVLGTCLRLLGGKRGGGVFPERMKPTGEALLGVCGGLPRRWTGSSWWLTGVDPQSEPTEAPRTLPPVIPAWPGLVVPLFLGSPLSGVQPGRRTAGPLSQRELPEPQAS